MRLPGLFAPLFFALFVALGGLVQADTWRSALYPENWQRPSPSVSFYDDALIQDFSYAGYRRGEAPIPTIASPVFNVVTTYGADATGTTDSTLALQAAINAAAAAGGGVVYLPAGTFLVSPQGTNPFALRISTSNIVLRGAGTTQTFLLNTSYTMNGKAVLQVSPPAISFGTLRAITADLDGPTRRIPVINAGAFAPGNIVRLEWNFTPEWVAEHDQQTWWGAVAPTSARYLREVVATNPAEGWIEIDIPTRYTMKTRDSATVRTLSGLLSNIGVESLSIGNVQHPGTAWGEEDYTDPAKAAYDTHNSFLVRFQNVFDSWITRVHSRQAATNTSTAHMLSNGILLSACARVTVQDSQMRRPQYGGGGGNGYMIRVQGSNECLVRNCVAEFSRHGLVVNNAGTSGNVFFQCEDRETQRATGSTGSYNTGGSGSDNHQTFSHSNLWDQCHAHNSYYTAHHRGFWGSTPPHGLTSAHGVYWNTSGSGTRYTNVVRSEQARYGYVIGTSGTHSRASNPTGGNTAPADILEGIGLGTTLSPQSLYLDQLARRLTPAVIYSANGATSGTAPLDALSPYSPYDYVTVLGPDTLAKTGFTFTGWNTSPDGSGNAYAPAGTFAISGTTYLYAQWVPASYRVGFDPAGGTPATPAAVAVEFGSPYGPLPAVTRTHFSFVGWFTAPSGGTLVTSATLLSLEADHTLHARWNALPVALAGSGQSVFLINDAPWSPAQWSTTAWYDAADLGSLTATLGAVTEWRDKSGRQNHLTQSEANRQPRTGSRTLHQLNVLDFNADYLFTSTGLGESIRSVFLVTAHDTTITHTSPGTILLSTAGGGVSTGDGYGASTGAFVGEVLSVFDENTLAFTKRQAASSATLPAISAGPHLFSYALATDWFIGLDGSENLRDLTSGASRNPLLFAQSFSIGAGARNHPASVEFFHDGTVAEVILLATTVTPAERQTVEGYLAHKWGLTAKLPELHPHKSVAPQGPVAVVTLRGTATDPDNDPLTHTWSVVAGPADVVFAHASALSTTATFSAAGTYLLRLTTIDGLGSASSELAVHVLARPAIPPGFATWSGLATDAERLAGFSADANADGVPDGLAWLLTATSPTTPAISLLPTVSAPSSDLRATFRLLPPGERGSAVVSLQYSTDLATWTTLPVPDITGQRDGVDFVITSLGEILEVQITLPAVLNGERARRFLRLLAELPTP